MFTLETPRLLVRPFTTDDLHAIHQILDVELQDDDMGNEETATLESRSQWLQWTILGYEQYAQLHQPPYGERAVVLKQTAEVIGAIGFVPCLDRFGQMPSLGASADGEATEYTTTELGLFYAISPAHQRSGYATEAARAMLDYSFGELRLNRIVATTTYENDASIRVMRKLGMEIENNPQADPPWLQVVGLLWHPSL